MVILSSTLSIAVKAVVWLVAAVPALATPITKDPLVPNIVDTSHATPAVADFFQRYYAAKNTHNTTLWLSFFHPTQVVYIDAALGGGELSRAAMDADFPALVKTWGPNSRSYPLRILGGTNSAIVQFVDTPDMFGGENPCSVCNRLS